MTEITRRRAVTASALAGVAGLAGATRASASPAAPGDSAVTTERYEETPSVPGIPRISWAVAHGGIVYISGITANRGGADVADQTRQVVARIDQLLAKAGTDKSKLLTSTVWLTDMANFAAHNDAWNEWVDHANAPTRACLLSPQLWRPGLLVEIMVTAAK